LMAGCFSGDPFADTPAECSISRGVMCAPGWACEENLCIRICATHTDCDPGQTCAQNRCVDFVSACGEDPDDPSACQILSAGIGCDYDWQCTSGTCADGVCCDRACAGGCQGCTAALTGGEDGTCADIPEGADPREACEGPLSCDGQGACYATPKGGPCDEGFECQSGFCVDKFCCDQRCDADCTACVDQHTGVADGTCATVLEKSDPNLACEGWSTCNAEGVCSNAGLGTPCEDEWSCISGLCVDGVCCDDGCQGLCERCYDPQAPGVCTVVADAVDEDSCSTTELNCLDGICACDGGGLCKPSSAVACVQGTDCASGVCVGGICCDGACTGDCVSCNSAHTGGAQGACLAIEEGRDDLDQCLGVIACDGEGQCFARDDGAACDAAYQCASGHCVDGVCCENACEDQCARCDGVLTDERQAGQCDAISAGEDPQNECPSIATCDGARDCFDKAQGVVCAEDYECQSEWCCNGLCQGGFEAPLTNTSEDLHAVWGTASNNVYAVGNAGTVVHDDGDGGAWQVQGAGLTTNDLFDIHGSGSANIMAVGANRTALHFDGNGWSWMLFNTLVTATTTLNAVWVVDDNLAYAVGSGGTILKHTDAATGWQPMDSGTTASLNDIVRGDTFYVGGGAMQKFSCFGTVRTLEDGVWVDLEVPNPLCVTELALVRGSLEVLGYKQFTPCPFSSQIYRTVLGSRGWGSVHTYDAVARVMVGDTVLGAGSSACGNVTQFTRQSGSDPTVVETPPKAVTGIWANDACKPVMVGPQGAVVRR